MIRVFGPLALWLLGCGAAQAGGLRFCEQPPRLSASQQDKQLRFVAIVKDELERSGQGVALVSRAGTDLSRFEMRYSHAGLALKASDNTPWSVRQLYYVCDEAAPKLYDQGLAGFLIGANQADLGFLSVVLFPPAQAAELERAALDKRRALQFLAPDYSANAYPFSARYQNCNQWVAELLAATLGNLGEGAVEELRPQAQAWLKAQGYRPAAFEIGFKPMLWGAAAFIPWVHNDDHPAEELAAARYLVSMPASIETFVQQTMAGAQRIEFCHNGQHVLIRRGWGPGLAEGCVAEPQDSVIRLN
ncbi:DUF2145 domain-containing protein [Roseateles oligotrophus]|uniref:DUF2145 domain-containing protein n=1 Tax=Roseateles oligotrophus TaxID=1769250 RepID=A0ABT2YJ60_9BURK|nr:DUF2145 domain-containing protein [Roseateles oligotrophus]MCV2370058.1 DUF2145 domain-containing protein [Roseateles oligotrophus]